MDRRVVIVALVLVLIVVALTLASLASGSAGPVPRGPVPSMSGEFADRQLASLGLHQSPSIHLPAEGWSRTHGPRQLRSGAQRPPAWI